MGGIGMSEALASSTAVPAGRTPVIVGGARTAIGRLLGSLAGFSGAELGGIVIKAALERAGMPGDQVDYVIMGQVLQAGAGQIPARQAAVAGGIPMTVPALTVNKVCLSGLDAIALASQLVRLGEFDTVVAGGMESMTQAPAPPAEVAPRLQVRPGRAARLDGHRRPDRCVRPRVHGRVHRPARRRLGITREEQDEFAALSHQRAAVAIKNGLFADEIVAVEIPAPGREPLIFDEDEGVRPDTTAESLAGCARPSARRHDYRRVGVADLRRRVRRGRDGARDRRRPWPAGLAEIGAAGSVAGPDNSLHSQPSNAIRTGAGKDGLTVADLDLVEINEAFAAVGIQSMRDLGIGRAGQHQRRRDRARPSDRRVRGPDRAAPGATNCGGAAAGLGPPGCAAAAARARR